MSLALFVTQKLYQGVIKVFVCVLVLIVLLRLATDWKSLRLYLNLLQQPDVK